MGNMKNTDEQKSWMKKRRKRRLYALAGALCLSALLTAYPDGPGVFSVFAAEAAVLSVSGTDWALDDNGVLTIESDAGMTDWINNGKTSNKSNVITLSLRPGTMRR